MDDSSISNEQGSPADARALVGYARRQADGSALTGERVAASSPLPDSFSGYDLLKEIHRGGQGVVYEAKQQSTRRKVAIKVLREGPFAGRIEQARFERETEILVRLKHPNIVAVLDAGITAEHRYLVMEFVEGTALDEYLVSGLSNPAPRNRIERLLRLFLKICEGLNAAHVRGVVHRDLKPSNIRIDPEGEPHVLDFGLGRLVGDNESPSSDGPSLTITGQFVGSLQWASPEQAEGASDKIDIRTDVHGLGLILFFMLTRRFPYNVEGPVQIVLGCIQRAEPAKPSALCDGIDDDLNTIVLRCLSKERERRYQSAGELARDVERYLDGEPIEAKRDSTWYVLSKTVQRHRRIAALLGAGCVLTAAYAVTATILYRRATVAEHTAVAERDRAVSAQAEADRNAEQARKGFRGAHQTAAFIVDELSSHLQDVSGATAVRTKLLEAAYHQFETLLADVGNDTALKADVARTRSKLGDIAAALARIDDALRDQEAALSIRAELAASEPGNLPYQRDFATSLILVGDNAKGRDDFERAWDYYMKALAVHERLAKTYPGYQGVLDDLAWSFERVGCLAERRGDIKTAGDLYEKRHVLAQQLVESNPGSLPALEGLRASFGVQAEFWSRRGDYRKATQFRQAALDIIERLFEADRTSAKYATLLVSAYGTEAAFAADTGDLQKASSLFQRTIPIAERLASSEPDRVYYVEQFSGQLVGQANLMLRQKNFDGANKIYQRALSLQQGLALKQPGDIGHQTRLMATLTSLVEVAQLLGRADDVASYSAMSLKVATRLVEQHGVDAETLRQCADCFLNLCSFGAECEPSLALSTAERATAMNNANVHALLALAQAQHLNGRHAEALQTIDQALSRIPVADTRLRRQFEELAGEFRDAAAK